jgi:RNA polymerase sigma-70 factor (ECF subfamily)
MSTEDDEISASDIQTSEIISTFGFIASRLPNRLYLYVIEEYKHREIANLLGISINTSKSQLILAKKKLKEIIDKKNLNLSPSK